MFILFKMRVGFLRKEGWPRSHRRHWGPFLCEQTRCEDAGGARCWLACWVHHLQLHNVPRVPGVKEPPRKLCLPVGLVSRYLPSPIGLWGRECPEKSRGFNWTMKTLSQILAIFPFRCQWKLFFIMVLLIILSPGHHADGSSIQLTFSASHLHHSEQTCEELDRQQTFHCFFML